MSLRRIEYDENRNKENEDESFFFGLTDEEVDELISRKTTELRNEIKTLNLKIETMSLENIKQKDTISSISTKEIAYEKELEQIKNEKKDFKEINRKYMFVAISSVLFALFTSEKCILSIINTFYNASRLLLFIIPFLNEWYKKPYIYQDESGLVYLGAISGWMIRFAFMVLIILLTLAIGYGVIKICKIYKARWCLMSFVVLYVSAFVAVLIVNWGAINMCTNPVKWIIIIQFIYLTITELIDGIVKKNGKTEQWESFQRGLKIHSKDHS